MKILSVDESAENRYLIEAVGSAQGFEVVSARNGLEALEELERQHFDLIISDVVMPEVDGFQLCHEVKARARTRHIPFIFYTATCTAKKDEELALSLGAERYVVKPVDPDRFRTIIEEVVSQARRAGASPEEVELKGTVDYLKAYNARLVAKLDHKIEQLEGARSELQASMEARDREIAQRQRAEEELSASQTMLQLVLDTMPVGVFWKDKDGRYLGGNRRFLNESGFSGQAELAGRGDSEMPWKEQAELFRDEDREVMESGQPRIGAQKPVFGADGVRHWLRTSKVPLPDSTGGVIGVLGTHEDITESKRAEETSRDRLEGFWSVVENAPEAIFVSTQGCFRYLNPPALRLLGAASDSELLNRPILESVHPDSRATVAEVIRQVQQGSGTTIPVAQKYLRRDGTILDIEGSIVPLVFEGEQGALVLVRDVTERKRAEEELRAKEDLLSESQRIAHLGSWEWTVGAGASALVWTQETYRLFGVSPDTFVLSTETFLNLLHPDDRTPMQAWMGSCLAGLQPPDLEFRIILPDGSVRYINGRGHVVARDPEVKRTRMVGVALDITERKHAEEKLRRFSSQLAETNEDLKRFTQIVLHDLRTPLVNLQGFSTELHQSLDTLRKSEDTLLANLAEPERAAVAEALQETIPEALSFIESSVTRMDHLTGALLRLSRASRRDLHMEELDAGALVQEALESLAHQIQGHDIAFQIGPLPRIASDRAAIKQIFGNLLDNAVKYLDPQRPGHIEVSAEEAADAVVFHVQDNGLGIAEEDMDKIFQPFRRAGAQDVPGEGVGLAFVRTFLHRLGGRIECHSQPGVGTTFSFTLPRVS